MEHRFPEYTDAEHRQKKVETLTEKSYQFHITIDSGRKKEKIFPWWLIYWESVWKHENQETKL